MFFHIYKAWYCLLVSYILANLLYFLWVILYINFQIQYPLVHQCLESQLFRADFYVNRWCTRVFLPSNWNKYPNALRLLIIAMYRNNNRILQPKHLSRLRCMLEIVELPFHKVHRSHRKIDDCKCWQRGSRFAEKVFLNESGPREDGTD